MGHFLNVAWSGVWLGSAYAAVAVALVVSYRAARIVNMAVGALFVFAALFAGALQGLGVEPPVAAVAAVVCVVLLAMGQEVFVHRPIAGASPQILLLGTLAVAIVLSGVSAILFGRDPVTGVGLVSTSAIGLGAWHTNSDVVTLVGAVVVVVALGSWAFESSRSGKVISAIGVDAGAAQLLGINVWRWRLVAMAFVGFLVGVAGVLFLPLGVLDFSQGLTFTLYGFVAAAIVGYYGIRRAMLGGWAFGIVSALGSAYVSSVFSQAVTFGILASAVLIGQRLNRESVFS